MLLWWISFTWSQKRASAEVVMAMQCGLPSLLQPLGHWRFFLQAYAIFAESLCSSQQTVGCFTLCSSEVMHAHRKYRMCSNNIGNVDEFTSVIWLPPPTAMLQYAGRSKLLIYSVENWCLLTYHLNLTPRAV